MSIEYTKHTTVIRRDSRLFDLLLVAEDEWITFFEYCKERGIEIPSMHGKMSGVVATARQFKFIDSGCNGKSKDIIVRREQA